MQCAPTSSLVDVSKYDNEDARPPEVSVDKSRFGPVLQSFQPCGGKDKLTLKLGQIVMIGNLVSSRLVQEGYEKGLDFRPGEFAGTRRTWSNGRPSVPVRGRTS